MTGHWKNWIGRTAECFVSVAVWNWDSPIIRLPLAGFEDFLIELKLARGASRVLMQFAFGVITLGAAINILERNGLSCPDFRTIAPGVASLIAGQAGAKLFCCHAISSPIAVRKRAQTKCIRWHRVFNQFDWIAWQTGGTGIIIVLLTA